MRLIVGLGNPGKEYDGTRHNIGFRVVDNYLPNSNWSQKFDGLLTSINYKNEKILFFKPLTFMNNSGIAISKIVNYYDIKLDQTLIIHDDLDLEVGDFKIKFDSSSGGHNGIKSIISQLNTQKFWRLKIGISKPTCDVKNYVLGRFTKEEQNQLNLNIYNDIINSFIVNGGEKTMSLYNKKRN